MDAFHPLLPVLALFLLQAKHLVIDWVWQPPYEHLNKHIFGHWGGIRHAGKNAIGTGLALWAGFAFGVPLGLVAALVVLDFVVHYLTDLGKTNLNRYLGYGPLTHPQFWWLTGADQFVHQITYLGLVALVIVQSA